MQSIREYHHHSDFVYAVAFSPDGKQLVSASKDRTVEARSTSRPARASSPSAAWNRTSWRSPSIPTASGRLLRLRGEHLLVEPADRRTHRQSRRAATASRSTNLRFSKDGKRVVSAGADRTVRTWDGATGTRWSRCFLSAPSSTPLRSARTARRRLRQLRRPGAPVGRGHRPPPCHAAGVQPPTTISRMAGAHARRLRGRQRQAFRNGARGASMGKRFRRRVPGMRCANRRALRVRCAGKRCRRRGLTRSRSPVSALRFASRLNWRWHETYLHDSDRLLGVCRTCNGPDVVPDDHARLPRGPAARQDHGDRGRGPDELRRRLQGPLRGHRHHGRSRVGPAAATEPDRSKASR